MKKNTKRLLSLMLSLILAVGMIPGTMTAYAAGTSGGGITLSGDLSDWNIKISDEGVLSWDAQASATKYELEFYEGVVDAYTKVFIGDLTTNSCDLKAAFEAKKIEHNEFYLIIKALKGTTLVGSTVSTSGTPDIRVQYMSSLPKLSEPQKLKHDATGQSWDSVPGATGYIFNLYDADGNNKARNIETDETALNFYKEDGWWFTVQATADGYRNSNAAESPKYGEVVTPPEPTVINELNATVTEPAIGAAPATTATTTGTDYTVSVSLWFEDATTFDETSFDGVFHGTSFEENVAYGVAITFTAEEGKTIASEPTVTINGKTAHLFNYRLDGTAVTYRVKFDKLVDTVIDELNATVTEPAIGGTPATTATTTGTDYTVSVSLWFEDATTFDETSFDGVFHGTSFEENVAYGVAITFTAEEGKTIASEPTVTINGKTAHLFNYRLDGTAVTYRVKFDKLEAETPPTEYDITVTGGTASVGAGTAVTKATAGTVITLTVDESAIPAGKVFDKWEVVSGGVTVTDGKFTMPESAVVIEASYKDAPVVPTEYDITVTGGTASANKAVAGTVITLTVDESAIPAGKVFDKWEVVSGGVTVADGKFTMPANAVEINATYKDAPVSHTCDIKPVAKVEPSCTEGGKEAYYKCEGCGKCYEDALGAKEITDIDAWGNLEKLGHTESDWKSDKDNHWKECTVTACGVIIEDSKAAHKDDNKDGKCDVCEYNVGVPGDSSDDDKPSDNPQTDDNSMIWLWGALLFVSGAGVVATTVYSKKRSSVK